MTENDHDVPGPRGAAPSQVGGGPVLPSLWRHADFMKLWTAETISVLGSQVTRLALPLTAVLVLHATPLQVGALAAVLYAPFLLFGLPVGVWVDRLPRRPLLILSDVVRAVALGTVPAAFALNALTMGLLYAVAFVSGTMTVLFDVADQSYLPSLVEREQLIEGNARLEVSGSGAQLAGPGLGGILIQLLGAPVAILADAVSYLGSALCLALIRRREQVPTRAGDPWARPVREIADGLRFVLGSPLLRPIAMSTAMGNLALGGMLQSVFLLYLARSLGMPPAAIGLVFGVGNTGALLGAFATRHLTRWAGLGVPIVLAYGLGGLSGLLIPTATPATALVVLPAAMAFIAFGSVVYNINQVSLRQAITPEQMQGRMNATMRFLIWGGIPLGAILWGLIGDAVGLATTIWAAVILNVVAVVPLLLSPVRRLSGLPAGPDAVTTT